MRLYHACNATRLSVRPSVKRIVTKQKILVPIFLHYIKDYSAYIFLQKDWLGDHFYEKFWG